MSGNFVTKGHDHGFFKVELQLSCDCIDCAKKPKIAARCFEGIEEVEFDANSKELTVMGKVDPKTLQERIKTELGRKAEVKLISPLPTNDCQVREEEKMKRKLIEELMSSLSIHDFQVREKEKMKRKVVEEFISSLTIDDLKKLVELISPLPKDGRRNKMEDGRRNKMGQRSMTTPSYEANVQQKLVVVRSGCNKDGSKTTKIQRYETVTGHKCSINQSENNMKHDDQLMKQGSYSKYEALLETLGFKWSTYRSI